MPVDKVCSSSKTKRGKCTKSDRQQLLPWPRLMTARIRLVYDVTQILIALDDGFLVEASAYAGPNRVWFVCHVRIIAHTIAHTSYILYVVLWLSGEACGVTGKCCGLSSEGTKKEEKKIPHEQPNKPTANGAPSAASL